MNVQYIELLKFNLESRKKNEKNIAVNVIVKKITEKKWGMRLGSYMIIPVNPVMMSMLYSKVYQVEKT